MPRLFAKKLAVCCAASLAVIGTVSLAMQPSDVVSERNLGALQEYADLHNGTLINARMADDALKQCVLSVSGAMMPPKDIARIDEIPPIDANNQARFPIERRAYEELSSNEPLHVIRLGRTVSKVQIMRSVFKVRTRCLFEDLTEALKSRALL